MRFFAYHTSFSYEIMLAKDKCHAKSVVLHNVAFEGESVDIGSRPYRGKDIMDEKATSVVKTKVANC